MAEEEKPLTSGQRKRLESIAKLKKKIKNSKFDPSLYEPPEQLQIEDINQIFSE